MDKLHGVTFGVSFICEPRNRDAHSPVHFLYHSDVEGVRVSSIDEFGCDHAKNLAERTGRDGDTVTRSARSTITLVDPSTRTRKIVTRDRPETGTLVLHLCEERDKCRAIPDH